MRNAPLPSLAAAILGLVLAIADCASPQAPAPDASEAAPLARFSAPAHLAAGTEAAFDASASFDPDGTIVSYRFLFGDGLPEVLTGRPFAAHVFGAPGDYTVVLEVEDDGGLSHEARHHVLVSAEAVPACGDAAPCPLGEACRDGLCWNDGPGDACASAGDCVGEDVGCYGGACTAPECRFDEDCGAGTLCRGGLCRPQPAATDGGTEDAG